MYARRVSMTLKPNSVPDFTKLIDKDIIPMLRRQKGFQDEITFVGPDGSKVLAISLWDTRQSAEAYNGSAFAEVTKILSKVVDGTPTVDNYDVANSTWHKIAATVPV